jgi:CRP/FNR family transcriptional regulator, anaerobic regulatory protein
VSERIAVEEVCTDHKWIGRADCAHCAIRDVMLFSGLPAETFETLLKPIGNEHFSPDAVLYHEGRAGQEVFSIRRGLVKLLSSSLDGNERIVRLLGQGSVVGLEVLDKGVPYQHTAIAVQPVDLCRIPVATLVDLERRHPELCNSVRKQVQQHVNRADHWIKHLNTGKARSRIAELLLLSAEIAADRQGDIYLLSRDDMAAIAGVTKETASRIIAEFKRHRLIYRSNASGYRVEAPRLRELIEQETAGQ